MAVVSVAVASYLSFYPMMLIIPLALRYLRDGDSFSWKKSIPIICTFAISLSCFLVISYKVFESWDFVDAVYIFM